MHFFVEEKPKGHVGVPGCLKNLPSNMFPPESLMVGRQVVFYFAKAFGLGGVNRDLADVYHKYNIFFGIYTCIYIYT